MLAALAAAPAAPAPVRLEQLLGACAALQAGGRELELVERLVKVGRCLGLAGIFWVALKVGKC